MGCWGGPSLVPHLGVRTLLISMDSEEGAKRRASTNFAYERVVSGPGREAPQWMWQKMTSRCKGERFNATVGAFAGHYKAWEALGNDAGIVVEDDAELVRSMVDVSALPQDAITLLGGVLRTPGTWEKEDEEWINNSAFIKHLATLQEFPALNKVPASKILFVWKLPQKGFLSVFLWVHHLGRSPASGQWLCPTTSQLACPQG